MTALIFDTETTGLVDFHSSDDDPCQPHIVQFAGMLLDDDGHVMQRYNALVRPDGWTISKDAYERHGISEEEATEQGLDEAMVLDVFLAMASRADVLVGHRVAFDLKVMQAACARYGRKWPENKQVFCTMRRSAPIVDLPPTDRMRKFGYHKPKAPTLTECLWYFFGEDLPDAHDAMADVRACAKIYTKLRG